MTKIVPVTGGQVVLLFISVFLSASIYLMFFTEARIISSAIGIFAFGLFIFSNWKFKWLRLKYEKSD